MRALPWFHMYHEARTDRKLARLSDREHRLWFNLLCYAAEQDQRGTIPAISQYLLAVEIGADGVEEVERLIDHLVSLRILSRDVTTCHEYVPPSPDDELDCHIGITFINFESRNSISPSDLPESTRERKQRQREREKQAQSDDGHEDVTPRHEDVTTVDKSREDKKREEKTRDRTRATAPKAKRATPLPADFAVTDDMTNWALGKQLTFAQIQEETERFQNHAIATGRTQVDWTRAWMNWLTSPYAKSRETPNGKALFGRNGPTAEYFAQKAKDLERQGL